MTRILGIKHGMARESFETVTKARELRKKKGWSVRRISEHMGLNTTLSKKDMRATSAIFRSGARFWI